MGTDARHLSHLTVHPLKSARGVSLAASKVAPGALPFDRTFVVIDRDGRIVTQRERPELARIVTSLDEAGGRIHCDADGAGARLTLTLRTEGAFPQPTVVRIWGREVGCHDAGLDAAAWISAVLGEGHRIVRSRSVDARSIDTQTAGGDGGAADHFADDAPILALAQASLDELSRMSGTSLASERFRPNVVVAGGRPYEEDLWDVVRIGDVTFQALHACARCVLTTVDPDTLERGPEPLRTLAATRRVGSDVLFGRYLVATGRGTISVGDPVVIERWRDAPASA